MPDRQCFRAVENTLRSATKSRIPFKERNAPEEFMSSFIMLRCG